MVYDRVCSGEVEAPEPEEPEVVTPDPVPIVIENPYKPECIVSKGNTVGDTGNAAFGTPFSSINQWQEFDTQMVPVLA